MAFATFREVSCQHLLLVLGHYFDDEEGLDMLGLQVGQRVPFLEMIQLDEPMGHGYLRPCPFYFLLQLIYESLRADPRSPNIDLGIASLSEPLIVEQKMPKHR
jgi:hypothetical protein